MVRRIHSTSADSECAYIVPGEVSVELDQIVSEKRDIHLARLLAKAAITSSVALLLTIVVASAMLAAADLRTIDVLDSFLSFTILCFTLAATAWTAVAAWKNLRAGIRTDKLLVSDIDAAFDLDDMVASWYLLLYKYFAAYTVSVEGLVA